MSSCRTFRHGSRREQKKANIGMRVLQKKAHAMIEKDPELYLGKLVELFLVKGCVTAGTKLLDLAAEAEIEEPEEAQPRRRSIIYQWKEELAQVDRENAEKAAREKAEKEAQEAAIAAEASSRELGQPPDQETEARKQAFTHAFVNAVKEAATNGIAHPQPAGQNSNTIANEIGLVGQSRGDFDRREPGPSGPGIVMQKESGLQARRLIL
jgi:hypothetical protein